MNTNEDWVTLELTHEEIAELILHHLEQVSYWEWMGLYDSWCRRCWRWHKDRVRTLDTHMSDELRQSVKARIEPIWAKHEELYGPDVADNVEELAGDGGLFVDTCPVDTKAYDSTPIDMDDDKFLAELMAEDEIDGPEIEVDDGIRSSEKED
jgi:hypothetical protein